jgi:hypothetical protein
MEGKIMFEINIEILKKVQDTLHDLVSEDAISLDVTDKEIIKFSMKLDQLINLKDSKGTKYKN